SLTSSLSGIEWTWNDKTTYGYQGRLWMEGGVKYTIYSKCDDGACVFFGGENGTKVASPGTTSGYNKTVCESYTPETTGWVDFYAYTWDWSGGKGPTKSEYWGLAYNTNGVTNTGTLTKGTEPWMVFQDSGTCETLYYELPESWLTVTTYGETETAYSATLNLTLPEDATDCEALILFDEVDRGDHRTSDWANSTVKAISGGTQTVTLEFPLPESGYIPMVRAVVKGKEANGVDFIEYSQPFSMEVNPVVNLAVSSVSYTGADFAATLGGLGSGATTVSMELTIWGDAGLTQAVKAVSVAEGLDSAQTVSCTVDGLVTNTTYWATLEAVNDQGHSATSDAVSFTILNPEPGRFLYFSLLQRSFKTMECQLQFEDYGAGSSTADIMLEISKTSDFAQSIIVPLSSVLGDLPQNITATAEDLEPGTDYWVRAKAVNTWALIAYSDALAFSTRPQPFVPSDISVIASDGGSTISMTLSEICDGVTGTVTLSVDGVTVQTWTIEEGASTLSCPAFIEIESGAQKKAVYSVNSEYEGVAYPATVETMLTGGTNAYLAGGLSDCRNFFPKAGETVTLPELSNSLESYFVANETVGELQSDGRTIKLLKAGGTAVVLHKLDPAGSTNIIVSSVPLVVPPVPAGEGKVFLWTEKNNLWRDPANWVCLNDASLTGVDYPHNVDDVAMILHRNGTENGKTFGFGTDENAPDIVLGEIYKGSLNSYLVNEGTIDLANQSDGGPVTNVMRFAKSDGSIPRIQFCSSQIKDKTVWLSIGRGNSGTWQEKRLLCDLSQGLIIDGGYGNAASNTMRRIFAKFTNVDVILPEGKELRIMNMNDVSTSINGTTLSFTSGCTISGGGRIVHDTPTYSGLWADMSHFTGTYVEATYHPKTNFDRVYGTFLRSTNVANAILEV
ncbi:MAG: fibronectin type III domain-containing protein, partial [Kiritimatiellia bacterium]